MLEETGRNMLVVLILICLLQADPASGAQSFVEDFFKLASDSDSYIYQKPARKKWGEWIDTKDVTVTCTSDTQAKSYFLEEKHFGKSQNPKCTFVFPRHSTKTTRDVTQLLSTVTKLGLWDHSKAGSKHQTVEIQLWNNDEFTFRFQFKGGGQLQLFLFFHGVGLPYIKGAQDVDKFISLGKYQQPAIETFVKEIITLYDSEIGTMTGKKYKGATENFFRHALYLFTIFWVAEPAAPQDVNLEAFAKFFIDSTQLRSKTEAEKETAILTLLGTKNSGRFPGIVPAIHEAVLAAFGKKHQRATFVGFFKSYCPRNHLPFVMFGGVKLQRLEHALQLLGNISPQLRQKLENRLLAGGGIAKSPKPPKPGISHKLRTTHHGYNTRLKNTLRTRGTQAGMRLRQTLKRFLPFQIGLQSVKKAKNKGKTNRH